jgi:hypothetical protein
MKTREDKILHLINLVSENPYKFSLRKLQARSYLRIGEIIEVVEKLNLEVLGFEHKNQRRVVEKFIEYNPNCTAEEAIKGTGAGMSTVYSVAKKLRHRFENDYSRRERNTRKKTTPLLIRQFTTERVKNRTFAKRIL